MRNINNYLYCFNLDLDTDNIKQECFQINELLQTLPQPEEHWINHYGSKSSAVHKDYNIFTWTSSYIRTLYDELRFTFNKVKDSTEPYAMQGWLNVYEKGHNINWHKHWDSEWKAWHGFYCVDVEKEQSHTEYNLPFMEENVQIESKNNLLVIGKSDNDEHRSSVWNQETPRITIAFDILPMSSINKLQSNNLNHWIPI